MSRRFLGSTRRCFFEHNNCQVRARHYKFRVWKILQTDKEITIWQPAASSFAAAAAREILNRCSATSGRYSSFGRSAFCSRGMRLNGKAGGSGR
jgi:hypothetical protein